MQTGVCTTSIDEDDLRMMLRQKCPDTILDNQFRCPQPGTILMGYPPPLLRELPNGSQFSSRG